MEIFLHILAGLGGILFLYYGAEFLVRGGVGIARRLHVSSLVIGLTLVAFGTSAPEFVVSVEAALRGMGDVSVGNVVGSNICNIALILGLCAMITPLSVNPKLFRLDVPVLAGSALLLAIVSGLTGGVGRLFGVVLFLLFVVYTVLCIRMGRSGGETAVEDGEVIPTPFWISGVFVVAGLVALVFGAKLFLKASVFMALKCGLSEAVIGLTVVAVGTSLPELATSLVAAIRGEKDIAVGNVIGSNIFNILSILGVASLVSPLQSPGVKWLDLGLMCFVSLLLVPLMKSGNRINRAEGAVLFAVYLAYTGWLVLHV